MTTHGIHAFVVGCLKKLNLDESQVCVCVCVAKRLRGSMFACVSSSTDGSLCNCFDCRLDREMPSIRNWLSIVGRFDCRSQVTKFQTGGPDGDLGSNEILVSKDRTIAIVDGSGVVWYGDNRRTISNFWFWW
jgi:hypothetical protein